MIKNILEGFALGALVAGLGVKNVLFWLLIAIAVLMVGITVLGLKEQGQDLNLLYTVLSYAGKALFVLFLFFMGRGVIRNPKLFVAAILVITAISIAQLFIGWGTLQSAVVTFLALTVPLVFVWMIDKAMLSYQSKKKALKKAL